MAPFKMKIKRKMCVYNAHFLPFHHKYWATLSHSTAQHHPVFSLRHYMLPLHQSAGMHHEFNFSMTMVEDLQFSHQEANYPVS